jgi:hypothetical protein
MFIGTPFDVHSLRVGLGLAGDRHALAQEFAARRAARSLLRRSSRFGCEGRKRAGET